MNNLKLRFHCYHFLIIISIVWLDLVRVTVSLGSEPCEPNPCIHGVCLHESTESNGFRCYCFDGYTGIRCERNFDECLLGRNRCQNSKSLFNK